MERDSASARRPRPRSVQVTRRDHELIGFVAEHRLVLAPHVQALLDVSLSTAQGRLNALCSPGLLTRQAVFHRQPAYYQVTRKGLALTESELPAPNLDLRGYRHDVGVGWLWVAAQKGTFGELREVISERRMRSQDGSADRPGEPHGMRLGGFGPGGQPRLHYPDLLLRAGDARRVALELELTRKGRVRREKILAGYGADARFDAVIYLVDDPAVARDVADSARRLGLSALVHVQNVRLSHSPIGRSAGAARQRTTTRAVEAGR